MPSVRSRLAHGAPGGRCTATTSSHWSSRVRKPLTTTRQSSCAVTRARARAQPQAAAAISALLPPERRAGAVTFAFLGWSIASAAGMPIGSWFGSQWGWRSAYLLETALALVAADHAPRLTPCHWGGWGYRSRPEKGTAVIIRRGEGLVLRLGDGRVFTVTVDDAETAVHHIRTRLAALRT